MKMELQKKKTIELNKIQMKKIKFNYFHFDFLDKSYR